MSWTPTQKSKRRERHLSSFANLDDTSNWEGSPLASLISPQGKGFPRDPNESVRLRDSIFSRKNSNPGGRTSFGWRRKAPADKIDVQDSVLSDDDALDDISMQMGRTENDAIIRMPLQIQIRNYLATSTLGVAIDVLSSALSVIACLLYVWSTYEPTLEVTFLYAESGICLFFLFEYILRFYVTRNRILYMISWLSIIDILTITPVIVDIVLHISSTAQGSISVLRLVRILRVLRIVRMLRIHRMFTYFTTEVMRETARFILNMLSITFITAACIHAFENSVRERLYVEDLTFHDSYYFTIVTVSTVGFGDIKPYAGASRVFITVVIIISLVYIPMSTNTLIRLLSEDSMYRIRKYRPRMAKHVLVLGDTHADGALKFLQEFFHPDHGGQVEVHVVFLMESLPSVELKTVIESQRYEGSVTYLQGSAHSVEDLDRAHAWDAVACFILARKFTIDEREVDRSTMMIALAIKQYHQEVLGSEIQLCLQLIRPESQRQYMIAFKQKPVAQENNRQPSLRNLLRKDQPSACFKPKEFTDPYGNLRSVGPSKIQTKQTAPRASVNRQDVVLCTNLIKMQLMAKHCLCPGIATFVSNLVISLDDDLVDRQGGALPPWQKEYNAGCDFELYRTKLTSAFSNLYFEDLALAVYMETRTLIIGLEISAAVQSDDGSIDVVSRLLLNPVGFVIPKSNDCSVHAVVLAEDRVSANLDSWKSRSAEPANRVVGVVGSAFYNFGASASPYDSVKSNKSSNSFKTNQAQYRASSIAELVERYNPSNQRPGNLFKSEKSNYSETFSSNRSARKIENSKYKRHEKSFAKASASLRAAKIHTHLSMEKPDVKGHIVFIGSTADFSAFMAILRDQGGSHRDKEVVILGKTPPTVQTWISLPEEGRNVFLVEGSPLDTHDLKRAGVDYASCAVVCTTQGQMKQAGQALFSSNPHDDSEALAVADADAIFAHQGILRLNPEIEIITEVVNTENVIFLETKSRLLHKVEQHFSFHADHVPKREESKLQKQFTQINPIRLHSQLTQQFKPMRKPTIQAQPDPILTTKWQSRQVEQSEPQLQNTAEQQDLQKDDVEAENESIDISTNDRHTKGLLASGTIFTMSLLDALLAQSFYNPRILSTIERLIAGEPKADRLNQTWRDIFGDAESSLLHLVPVPEDFIEDLYGNVFRYFCLEKGMLPVGIARGVAAKRAGISNLGNRHRYVLTNPEADTVLHRHDKVYVLSLVEPEQPKLGNGMFDLISVLKQGGGQPNQKDRIMDMKSLASDMLEEGNEDDDEEEHKEESEFDPEVVASEDSAIPFMPNSSNNVAKTLAFGAKIGVNNVPNDVSRLGETTSPAEFYNLRLEEFGARESSVTNAEGIATIEPEIRQSENLDAMKKLSFLD